MRSVFCDHNFLIQVSKPDLSSYKAMLLDLVDQGVLKFVIGLWTLVEIARSPDDSTMAELCAAIETLRPWFLPERTTLQRHEVEQRVFAHMGIQYDRPATFRTLKQVAAEFVDRSVPIGRDYAPRRGCSHYERTTGDH